MCKLFPQSPEDARTRRLIVNLQALCLQPPVGAHTRRLKNNLQVVFAFAGGRAHAAAQNQVARCARKRRSTRTRGGSKSSCRLCPQPPVETQMLRLKINLQVVFTTAGGRARAAAQNQVASFVHNCRWRRTCGASNTFASCFHNRQRPRTRGGSKSIRKVFVRNRRYMRKCGGMQRLLTIKLLAVFPQPPADAHTRRLNINLHPLLCATAG